jgi:hypothetical protein
VKDRPVMRSNVAVATRLYVREFNSVQKLLYDLELGSVLSPRRLFLNHRRC